jgi:hypothetical protein
MPDIIAALDFLAKSSVYETEKPYTVIPPLDSPQISAAESTNVERETQESVTLTDIRSLGIQPTIATHGFQVLQHATKYPQLDTTEQRQSYQREATNVLKRHFMAERVITFDLKVRMFLKRFARLLASRVNTEAPCHRIQQGRNWELQWLS